MLPQRSGCAGLGITAFLADCSARGYDGAVTINAGGPVVNGCGVTISGETTYYMDVSEWPNYPDPPLDSDFVLFATAGPVAYSHGPGSYYENDVVILNVAIPVNYFLYRVREVRTQVGYATIYRTTVADYICGTS